VQGLQDAISNKTRDLEMSLAMSPQPEPEPIGALHDLIIDLSTQLREVLVTREPYSGSLYDPQRKLEQEILATLPDFLPYREADEEFCETYKGFWPDDWPRRDLGRGSGNSVYLDAVYQVVKAQVLKGLPFVAII